MPKPLHQLRSQPVVILLVAAVSFFFASSLNAEEPSSGIYRLVKQPYGLDVVCGEQLITSYRIESGPKPILFPLRGLDGLDRTRSYPMIDTVPNEAHDHIHHRSLWFTHGEVNDVDFWAEGEKMGKIVHQKFTCQEAGEHATIAARNHWLTVDNKLVCTENREFIFRNELGSQVIDATFVLTAPETPVHFGDTKEGSFGIRVAETMKVEAKLGGKIINSRGATNEDAWGKPAEWVDYVGPVANQTVGVAILVHPSSFNYPGRWHVRTYGLFAANPFGEHHFTGAAEKTKGFTLDAGKSLTLRYRVVLHAGDDKSGRIADHWKSYSAQSF